MPREREGVVKEEKFPCTRKPPHRWDQRGAAELRELCNSGDSEDKIQRKFSNSTSQPIGSLQATAWTRGLGKGA